MEREIKFRGLYKNTWVYGSYMHGKVWEDELHQIENVDASEHRVYNVPKESVGQFTGLYDKNGTEIYEGDIIDIEDVGRAEVIFNAGAFMTHWIDDKEALMDCVGFRCRTGRKWDCVVLGNVYEHPNLLKEEA